jgi:hypothetical protein
MILRGPEEIKVGDVFYNVQRSSMLRVRAVHGEWADYLSWRPDGTRASNKGKVKVKNLTLLPYFRVKTVNVYTDNGSFGFGLSPEVL